MAKKSSSGSKKSNKVSSLMNGGSSALESGLQSVSKVSRKQPNGGMFWGLGAIAVGAGAYAPYVYREELISAFSAAVKFAQGDDAVSDDDANMAHDSDDREDSVTGAY